MVLLYSRVYLLFILVSSMLIQSNVLASLIDSTDYTEIDVSSFKDKFSFMLNRSQDAVKRFRCPKGWQRFGGSCYHLSNVTSTTEEVNHTCHLTHFDRSQLMQIRHPIEFFYAAHILVNNDLGTLLIEINSHSIKDKLRSAERWHKIGKQWQTAEDNFRQARVNYFNRIKKKFCRSLNEERSFDSSICTETNSQSSTSNHVVAGEEDLSKQDEPITVNDLHRVCDDVVWDVVGKDSNVFVLYTYFHANKRICAVTDVDSNMRYRYTCQYVLDYCFGNDVCGIHGRCVNVAAGFRCFCYFYVDGDSCRTISTNFIQLLVSACIIALILITLKVRAFQNLQKYLLGKLCHLLKNPPCTSASKQTSNGIGNNSVQSTSNIDGSSETEQNTVARLLFVCGLMALIFLLLCIIPIFCHRASFQSNDINAANLKLLLKDTIQTLNQCKQKSIFKLENHIFIVISVVLCIVFYGLMKIGQCCQCRDCLPQLKPFAVANRYEIAALVGIVMTEIFMALEQFIIDISELWNRGVLMQFWERTFIPLFYSARYYIIFISLSQRNRNVRLLAFIYSMINLMYIIIRRCSCVDFSPPSKFSIVDQAKHRLELGYLPIIYEQFKNAPQSFLLAYLGAELTVRLFYDSIFRARKQKPVRTEVLTPGPEFDYHSSIASSANRPKNNNSSTGRWIKIKKKLADILHRGDDYQFSTIATSAYLVAYVLVFYLTCLFAFRPFLQTSSMTFLIFCLEQALHTEIDEWSFRTEMVCSAILTMFIFCYRLFVSIRSYKEHILQLRKGNHKAILPESELEPASKASQSVGYLSFVFLNVVGGFLIWFYIILFLVTICNIFFFHAFTFQIYRLEVISSLIVLITPVLVLYGLKKYITQWFSIFTTSNQSKNLDNNTNVINNVDNNADVINNVDNNAYVMVVFLTFIFSCHIAVVSSVLRLVKGVGLNIWSMPRFDCSYFGRQWEKSDSGYMAYVSYLHMEKGYTPPACKSISVQTTDPVEQLVPESNIKIPISNEQIDDYLTDADTNIPEQADAESYDSPEGEDVDELNDTASVISDRYQHREIILTKQEQQAPAPGPVNEVPFTHQQRLTNVSTRRRTNQQDNRRKSNPATTSLENRPLIRASTMDSEDDETSVTTRSRTRKTTTSKPPGFAQRIPDQTNKRKSNYASNSRKQQSSMTSTPVISEDDETPPAPSPRTHKTTSV